MVASDVMTTRLDHLVILAGGRATRLGPITATMSKALVTVGSQPMIVRQIVGIDAERVTVVASPSNSTQVSELLERTFGDAGRTDVIEQARARGPVDAVRIGLRDARPGERTVIVMADSLFDFDEVQRSLALDDTHENWVSVVPGQGLPDRHFCWAPRLSADWEDSGMWGPVANIFTGMIVTKDPVSWRKAANREMDDGLQANEIGMSSLLRRMRPATRELHWYDTGDVPTLARTTRELFIKRDHHKIILDDLGCLVKSGCSRDQARYLANLPAAARPLFPAVHSVHGDEIIMEFVDLPSLGELWLYWPGTTDLWQHIVGRLIDVVREHLWPAGSVGGGNARVMLIDKLLERTHGLKEVDPDAITALVERLEPIVTSPIVGLIHGDLNMTNVLYSARTDTFRLLDPRGSWGDDTGLGDVRYDVAKLRYSWRGFVSTVHGIPNHHGTVPGPALDQVLEDKLPFIDLSDVAAIEASIFLSALPLHPKKQWPSLIRCGYACLEEAVA